MYNTCNNRTNRSKRMQDKKYLSAIFQMRVCCVPWVRSGVSHARITIDRDFMGGEMVASEASDAFAVQQRSITSLSISIEAELDTFSTPQESRTRLALCCVLLWFYTGHFTHIPYSYITGSEVIIRLPHCQWSNPVEYGRIDYMNYTESDVNYLQLAARQRN